MNAQEFFNAEFDDRLSRLQRLIKQHRQELYDRVREQRDKSYYEERYPEELQWPANAHPGDTEQDFVRKFNHLVDNGLWVNTKVEWLSPFEEVEYEYEWKNREQMNEEELERLWPDRDWMQVRKKTGWHKTKGDYAGLVPENPLLAITVTPARGTVLPVAQYRTPGEPFHCSLAKYWELGPNIYDPGQLMEHLLLRFHNKEIKLFLEPTHRGDRWFDKEKNRWIDQFASGMSLDHRRDPIATDMWAQWAKAQGSYHSRDWHISL